MTGIVILNYNNLTDVVNCINSVFSHTPNDIIKVVVVDNGSEEKIRSNVSAFLASRFNSDFEIMYGSQGHSPEGILKRMTYLMLEKNIGYACGNNAGIELLLTDKSITEILVLNSDIIFVEDIVSPLVSTLTYNDKIGAISPLLRKKDGTIEHCCARKALSKSAHLLTFSYAFHKLYRRAINERMILKETPELLFSEQVDIELPSGSCMMFKVETIKAIGGFDKSTFLYYEEDILNKKLQEYGKINLLIPSVYCIHVGGATTNKVKTAYFLKKCNYNSLLYYLETYENCSFLELLFFKLTAKIRLGRLWLGMIYHKICD